MLNISSFRRITSSGKFVSEIDGLRFFAILSVVLCHLCALIAAKNPDTSETTLAQNAADFFFRGRFGVQLFFVISGLVLGIPFCKKRMHREKNMNLREYFIRRLTRIEPPYILVMIALFFANVYLAHTIDFNTGLKSLGSSLLYSHNFIYGRHIYPYLTSVAWSLEIEIQFYILVPLLSCIFLIQSPLKRRGLLIFISVVFTFLSSNAQFSFLSLYDFLQYFMVGFLLADFYNHKEDIKKYSWASALGYISFLGIWLFDFDYFGGISGFLWQISQLFFLFVFYFVVLFQDGFNWVKNKWIVTIGGMCYSIYLLHYPIISLLGNYLTQFSITGYLTIDNSIYLFIILAIILFVSSVFFILIERPCMNRYWYRGLLKRKNKTITSQSK